MAKIEDLINEIKDARLKNEIGREVANLKKQKNFGLVFEEHIPEQVQLAGLPIKRGARVVKRGGNNKEVFVIEEVHSNGRSVIVLEDADGTRESVKTSDLIVVKRFGEPIYPTLVPVDRLTRVVGKPYHTIINADNFHALQLLLYCYEGQVDVIYIDPPYNTGARDWKYNNNYVDSNDQWRHSKWLSMMKKRLLLAKRLLKKDGILIAAIDDYEMFHFGCLLEDIFPGHVIETAIINHHPQGGGGGNLSRTHEYAIFCVPQCTSLVGEDVDLETDDWSLMRSGTDKRNYRVGRPKQFYALLVDSKSKKIIGVGPNLDKTASYPKGKTKDGCERAYPVDGKGQERVWRFNRTSMIKKIEAGKIFMTERGAFKVQVDRKEKSDPIFTNWTDSKYNAGTHGTSLLKQILGASNKFSYPKSLYTVFDCLAAACRNRTNALILDFFAGSGTSYHATCLLNEEHPGARRCILVTNNEVDADETAQLNQRGLIQGDQEFEKHGICEAVTWPKCKYVTQGCRDDGTPLSGEYLNGSLLSDGFKENLEYFRLDFLDPTEIALGEKFEAILPVLWLMAGANGEREAVRGFSKWFMPKNSPYAILIKEENFIEFKRECKRRPDIKLVFLVTDSEEAFRHMTALLPEQIRTKMLYKNYLDNFKINVEKVS